MSQYGEIPTPITSLYGEYIKERLGKSIVENQFGFATYYFLESEVDGASAVYVEDVFVKKEEREKGVGSMFLKEIGEIANAKFINLMIVTVKPSSNGSTEAMKAILASGFSLVSAAQDAIMFKKEI